MKIKVVITLKNGVLDPQGKAIQQTLNGMGFSDVNEVRQGKFFDIEIKDNNEAKDKPSRETPAFANANRGIIPKATYGLIACSIFINKEKSLSFFL